MEGMQEQSKLSKGFIVLVVVAVLLAGFLTWNLVKPQQAEKFYENALGYKAHQPTSSTVGKGIIQFKKTEE